MRSCPQCGARYTDDLRFCLHDGTTLVAATTDELSGLPTEQFSAATFQENDPAAFRTLPSAETPEAETRIAPPKTAQQYSFSAVDPASKMGCSMTFGKVAAALLFVAGLGLAGIIFTSYQYTSMTAKVEPTISNTMSAPPPTSTNSTGLDPGMGGHSTSNAANTAANSAPVSTPSAPHTPSATPQPTSSQITSVAPPKSVATPAPEDTPFNTDGPEGPGRVMRAGQLNGRATSLPRPPYPPAARAVGASGPVRVRVLVDDSGIVISANAVSGHPLLQAAAVSAARQARFPPLPRRGMRVTGFIVYNFVP